MRRLSLFAGAVMVLMAATATYAVEGPYPAEVMAWTPEIKEKQRQAGTELLARIQAAIEKGEKQITVEKGNYRFNKTEGSRQPTHILWSRLNGVTIDFQGSNLWMETDAAAFVISNSQDVTIRNVFIDWDPLPFIQGEVVAIDNASNTLRVKLDPGYERAQPAVTKNGSGRIMTIDPKTNELKVAQIGAGVAYDLATMKDGIVTVKYRGFHNVPVGESGIEKGDRVAMLNRTARATRIEGSKGCALEDVTLYSSPFIGFIQAGGQGAKFLRCQILRRPGTNRLIGGNADGFNCANLASGPVIDSCRIDTIGDDFVNVHGHLARVIWQESPTELIVSRMNYRGTITEPVEVEFLERATMKPLGRRTITATVVKWTIEEGKCLADLKHKWNSGEASGLAYGKPLAMHKLTLNEPIEIKGDVIVACESFSGRGAIIRNCDFKGSLARGLRLQSPGAIAENNRLSVVSGSAISLYGHASFWGEGPYVHSAKVIGNTFINSNIGAGRGSGERAAIMIREGDYKAQHLPHDIEIRDNTFLQSWGAAIVARGVDNLTITGNKIEDYWKGSLPIDVDGKKSEVPGLGAAIVVDGSKNLKLEGNTITKPGVSAHGDIFTADVELAK